MSEDEQRNRIVAQREFHKNSFLVHDASKQDWSGTSLTTETVRGEGSGIYLMPLQMLLIVSILHRLSEVSLGYVTRIGSLRLG